MGIDPTRDKYEPGNICNICEGVIFDGVTPKYIEVVFKEIEGCPSRPAAPDGSYLMTQLAAACKWQYLDALYQIDLEYNALESKLTVFGSIYLYFKEISSNLCKTKFVSTLSSCGGPFDGGKNGEAEIFWGPTINP